MKLRLFGIPIFEYRATHETDGVNLTDPKTFLEVFGRDRKSKSGQQVSEDNALAFSAVWACVRILSETMASLPLGVFKRTEKGKEAQLKHPIYHLLHDEPNERMTSFVFRETMMAFVVLWGNAYAKITHRGDMRVDSLDILHPDAVTPFIASDGKLYYRVQYPDHRETLTAYEVLHVPGLGFDGIKGKSPIDVAKEAIGLGLAAEDFGANFFGNGANSDVVLSHPSKLSQQGKENLGSSFDRRYRGVDAGKTIVLEEGVKMERVTIPPDAAQFLQTRKFQIAEIARIFRVPPHLIGDLERSTNNNIEHQSIEFVMHTIRPWVKRFEQEFDRKLFYEAEKGEYFTKFNLDGLLRADSEARATIMTALFNSGAMTSNEIREANGLNSVSGGDTRYVNANLMAVGDDGMPVKNEDDGEGD